MDFSRDYAVQLHGRKCGVDRCLRVDEAITVKRAITVADLVNHETAECGVVANCAAKLHPVRSDRAFGNEHATAPDITSSVVDRGAVVCHSCIWVLNF